MIRALRGSIKLKSEASARLASSAMAPAISTPVGPPPITTKVISRARSSASSSFSARSKASRMRRRRPVASSNVFSPGAKAAQSSWPK